MKQQTENKKQQNRKGLLAALLVCLAGLLLAAAIIGGTELYRKKRYTMEIRPEDYRITDICRGETTMTHADGTSSTDETDRITVEYCVDGTVYRDEISMLSGTKTAQEIRVHFRNQDHHEEILGSLWIAPEEPSSIGRYGEEIWIK